MTASFMQMIASNVQHAAAGRLPLEHTIVKKHRAAPRRPRPQPPLAEPSQTSQRPKASALELQVALVAEKCLLAREKLDPAQGGLDSDLNCLLLLARAAELAACAKMAAA
jgi:hypothetical protein